jgi:hypothetical protein
MAGAAAFQAGFFRPQGEPRSRARLGFGCRSDPRLGQDLQPGPAPPARKGRRAARSSHRTEALVQNEPEVAPRRELPTLVLGPKYGFGKPALPVQATE